MAPGIARLHGCVRVVPLLQGTVFCCSPAAGPARRPERVRARHTPDPAAAQTSAIGELDASFDAGGHKLHLRCQGKGSSGSPTVVYLHGLGGDGSDVDSINTLLAGQVRVCTYDRLNVGRSDRATGRHTGADSVRDLHALLDAAAVQSRTCWSGSPSVACWPSCAPPPTPTRSWGW